MDCLSIFMSTLEVGIITVSFMEKEVEAEAEVSDVMCPNISRKRGRVKIGTKHQLDPRIQALL